MYPEEALKYIEDRNHWLSTEENSWFQENVVINHAHYDAFSGITEMWDEYGNHYWYNTYQIVENIKEYMKEKRK